MYTMQTTGTTPVNADSIATGIYLVQEISVTQLSMLAIAISDILRRELYALPCDG